MILLLAALAAAEEPDVVIDVYDEAAVALAREAIVDDLDALGWEVARRREGEVVFRPPRRWMGRAHLLQDGTLSFGRPVVAFDRAELLEAPEHDAGTVLDRTDTYAVLQTSPDGTTRAATAIVPQARLWVLPSGRLLAGVHGRVEAELAEELATYRGAVRAVAHRDRLAALPADLDLLWTAGRGFDGALLDTPAARRAAVLDLWATRAPGREGDEVSAAIELWLREVVQSSGEPVTPAERRAAEARRVDGRSLDLGPAAEDPASLAPVGG